MKEINPHELSFLIRNEIKLVIWDMDDTFWRGTISEGTVTIIEEHLALLQILNERGILNSICSKNEFDVVEVRLKESDIWDDFVFPSINWESKGARIQRTIEKFGFLCKNTLFIDDNVRNLEEARYYNSEINTLQSVDGDLIRSSPHLQGNPNKGHDRLQEYKISERRFKKKESFSSNRKFLIDSEIKVFVDFDVESHLDRCIELNNRSNQLNFSKNRCDDIRKSRSLMLKSLNKFTATGGAVFCRDKYNDYGLIGYFIFGMMRNDDPSEALFKSSDFHFVFSCRILNMGIEQFIYKGFIKGEGRANSAYPSLHSLRDFEEDLCYISRFDNYDEYMDGNCLSPPIREKMAYVGSCETVHTISFIHHECHELYQCRFLELSDDEFESLFEFDLLVISLWLHAPNQAKEIQKKVEDIFQRSKSDCLKVILIDAADVRFRGRIILNERAFLVSKPFDRNKIIHDSMHYHRSEYIALSKLIVDAYHRLNDPFWASKMPLPFSTEKPKTVLSRQIQSRKTPDLWTLQSSRPTDMHGLLGGAAVFLIAGGPSFNEIDLDLLDQAGCLTMGLNNSPKNFRPDYWISVDEPSHFLRSIWLDPKIVKFVRSEHRNKELLDSEVRIRGKTKVDECPSIVFYESNLNFKVSSFLIEPSISWGGDASSVGRSVMLAALKTLYHLGAGHVFLLGVDFQMSSEYTYHFPQERSKSSVDGNRKSYHRLAKIFEELHPLFEAENFHVWNCNQDSHLKAFPFLPFEDAIAFARSRLPSAIGKEKSKGLYDRIEERNNSAGIFADLKNNEMKSSIRRIDRNKRPKPVQAESLSMSDVSLPESAGVLLLADSKLEWMLPWWMHNFERSNSELSVAIVDVGLSSEAVRWLTSKDRELIRLPENLPELRSAWFYKPFAILNSPFEATVFSDLDCEIRGDISQMNLWSSDGLVIGNDLFPVGESRKLFREKFYYNTGLIGVRKDNPIISSWCEETVNLHSTLRSDQEVLNLVLYEKEARIVELPAHYHQLRLEGDHKDAVVMHWTGDHGKNYIRKQIQNWEHVFQGS